MTRSFTTEITCDFHKNFISTSFNFILRHFSNSERNAFDITQEKPLRKLQMLKIASFNSFLVLIGFFLW